LRDSVARRERELLGSRDWSAIKLADVAAPRASAGRPYTKSSDRGQGMAQGYALRMGRPSGGRRRRTPATQHRRVYAAFRKAFEAFSKTRGRPAGDLAADGGAKRPDADSSPTDSGPIITQCSARLTSSFVHSWISEKRGRLRNECAPHRPAGHEHVSMPPPGGRPRTWPLTWHDYDACVRELTVSSVKN